MRRPAGLSLGKAGGWLRREAIHQAARQPGLDPTPALPFGQAAPPRVAPSAGFWGLQRDRVAKRRVHPKRCRLGECECSVACRGHNQTHAEGRSLPLCHPGGTPPPSRTLRARPGCSKPDSPAVTGLSRGRFAGCGGEDVGQTQWGQAAHSVTAGASHPPFPHCLHGSWTKRPREGR